MSSPFLTAEWRKLALANSVLGVDAQGGPKFDAADLDALLAPLGSRAITQSPEEAARRWGRTGGRAA